jgi:hypothetical protein
VIFQDPDEALQWWAHARHRAESVAAFNPVAMVGRQFAAICEHCRSRAAVRIGLARRSGKFVGSCTRCNRERAAQTVYILRGQVEGVVSDASARLAALADVEIAIETAARRDPEALEVLRWYVLGGLSLRDLIAELRSRGVSLTLWGLRRAVRRGRSELARALAARELLTDPARWADAPRGGRRAGARVLVGSEEP